MKNYLIANWKQNKNSSEVLSWFEEFKTLHEPDSQVGVVICPSFPYLSLASSLKEQFKLSDLKIGAQDISLFEGGSHTGEVAGVQLKEFCTYVIVGHSEKAEARDIVFNKVHQSINAGLKPIVCIADIEEFRREWSKEALLVWEDPKNISKGGVYVDAPIDKIVENVEKIRQYIGQRDLIYGGSTNETNIKALSVRAHFNGFLVGNASLSAATFNNLFQSLKA